jgi:rhodanese-related sulfurtransferase
MTTGQIFLYALIALVVFYIVRKFFMIRSIKHYSAQEASQKIKKERNVVLLDVRSQTERKQGSIKGSFHIPLPSIRSSQNELKKFKDAEIICYCRTGNRSLNAAAKLKRLGFNVANLRGGILRWNAAGLK